MLRRSRGGSVLDGGDKVITDTDTNTDTAKRDDKYKYKNKRKRKRIDRTGALVKERNYMLRQQPPRTAYVQSAQEGLQYLRRVVLHAGIRGRDEEAGAGAGGERLSDQVLRYFHTVWLLTWCIVAFLLVRLVPRLRQAIRQGFMFITCV